MTILLLVVVLFLVAVKAKSFSNRIGNLEAQIRDLEATSGGLTTRTEWLARDTAALRSRVARLEAEELAGTVPVPPAPPVEEPAPIQPPAPPEPQVAATSSPPSEPIAPEPIAVPYSNPTGVGAADAVSQPGLAERCVAWLFGGNTVVRVGVVVLFFGVAFFLNYAIDQGWLPIEARLTLAALGGLGISATGWYLRETRRDYGLVLQGGGLGVLYLTVYAAVSLYSLIAAGAGLALMVVLVALSCALAVLQDARGLATLAAIGGFLAPILTSRGGGNHVVLFSYYAVLNAGILGVAWFKTWRELNLIGFVSTFVIGAMWGAQFYRPEHFSTTEPFLAVFFLMYLIVPVLSARREQSRNSAYVDGSLVFGLPVVAFALQTRLVADFEYGTAFSALAAGLVYVAATSFLWRRLPSSARLLLEAFLALGVAFGTLAIPFAVDGQLTGSAWALEGVGLVWVGVRQNRPLALAAGVLLQIAAGGMYLDDVSTAGPPSLAVLNSAYLGAFFVSLAGFLTAWHLDRRRDQLKPAERAAAPLMLTWALVWWFTAGFNEIGAYVPFTDIYPAFLAFSAASSAILTVLCLRLPWRRLGLSVLALLPIAALLALVSPVGTSHPLNRWGGLAWPVALTVLYWAQRRLESGWPDRLVGFWHQGLLWLVVFVVSVEGSWLMSRTAGEGSSWPTVPLTLVPAAAVASVPWLSRRVSWPFARFATSYQRALIPLVALIAFWVVLASMTVGDSTPLPFVPLLNPLELAQCISLVVLFRWIQTRSRRPRWSLAWAGLAFVALNGIVARATHFHGGIDFEPEALWSSALFQTTVSITWTVLALAAMTMGSWTKQRMAWFAGAVLLAAVVLKLFVVDLGDVGTVARIVSFIGVGLLMLLVGYVSPLPPQLQEQRSS